MRAIALAAVLLATPAMADDYPPGPGTPGVIVANGTPVAGVFDAPGDADAFTVQLPADGRAFAFTVQNDCHAKSVELYDAGFTLLRAPRIQGRPDQDLVIEWRPGYTGLYYVVVRDLPLPAGYTCPVAASDSYLIGAGESCSPWIGTRCTLDDIHHKHGTIRGVGDRNWYEIQIGKDPSGQRQRRVVYLDAAFLDDNWSAPFVTLRAANGAWLTDNTQPNRFSCGGNWASSACAWVSLCPGRYFLAVRDDGVTRPARYDAGAIRQEWEQPGSCPR
jgi:hypothetical protein